MFAKEKEQIVEPVTPVFPQPRNNTTPNVVTKSVRVIRKPA